MAAEDEDVERFAELFRRFMEAMTAHRQRRDSPLRDLVREHLGVDPAGLPLLAERFATVEHPNLQLALDSLLGADPAQSVVGLPTELRHYGGFSLAGVLGGRFHGPADPSPIEYVNVAVDVDQALPCAQLAVYLLRIDGVPVVVFLLLGDEHTGGGLGVEVLAPERHQAEGFVLRLRALMLELNVTGGSCSASPSASTAGSA